MEPKKVMEYLNADTPTNKLLDSGARNPSLTSAAASMSRYDPVGSTLLAQDMLQPARVIAALERGVEAFFSYTGCIFHIYDRNEAQEGK
jgi:hypothetical protein